MTINEITTRLVQIWQAKIRDKKLVKSGHLINSIKFIEGTNGLELIGEEYYIFLDSKYNISKEIMATQEFKNLIGEYAIIKLQKQILDIK